MSTKHPQHWRSLHLGDVGTWSGGGTPSKLNAAFWTDGTIPWVSPKDMKVFRLVQAEDHITEAAIEGSATKIVPRESVLMVVRSGILAHSFPVAVCATPVTLNQDMKALTPDEGVDAVFVAYFLVSSGSRIIRECAKNGTTVASIEFAALKGVSIGIPPIQEQRDIVAAIEAHFSRLDAAEQGLKRVQAKLKHARASVLKAAVEGRLVPTEAALARAEGRRYEPGSALLARVLAERRARWAERGERGKYKEPVAPETEGLPELPEGWVWASCDQAGDILLGRQRAPQYLKGISPRPYLRVANIRDNWIDWRDVEEMDFSDEHFAKYRLESGDILLCEGQSPELVGQSAIYRGERPNVCFQKTLHRFRPLIGGPTPEFAQIVFRAWVMNRVFMRRASITTNIAHLTLEKLRAAPFSLPPLAEQARIVAEVDRRLSVLDQVEALVGRSLTRCASLRQSILKRAFEGRLVPPSAEVTPE
ncbi:restriction endonuclease subunit S [Myxococcota bacterium]|nr:restriction endonuclease subunit S [Myxococcota bacterium]